MPLIIKGRNLIGTGQVVVSNPTPETKNVLKPADDALKAKFFKKSEKPVKAPEPIQETKNIEVKEANPSLTQETLKKRFAPKKTEKVKEEIAPNRFDIKRLFNKKEEKKETSLVEIIELVNPAPARSSLEIERIKRKENKNQKTLNIVVEPTSEEQMTLQRSFVIEKNKLKGVASADSRLVVNGKERKIGRKSNYLLDMLTLDDE